MLLLDFMNFLNQLVILSQLTQWANTKGNIFSAKKQEVFVQGTRLSSSIPQLDGPIPDPYDDVLSTPNVSCCFYTFDKYMHEAQ